MLVLISIAASVISIQVCGVSIVGGLSWSDKL